MPPLQEENDDDHNPPKVRADALREANVLYSAFFGVPLNNNENNDDGVACTTKKKIVTPKNERLCMGGHRETVFGLSFSHDGKYMASASQDSKICIWDVSSHRLLATLSEGIDDKFECLRVAWMNMDNDNDDDDNDDVGEKYFLASAGADGIVRLWSGTTLTKGEGKLKWHAVGTLDHCNGGDDIEEEGKEDNKPQIYALQFIQSKIYPNRNILLTSTDDCIHLWNVVNENDSVSTNTQSSPPPIKRRKLLLYISVQFTHINGGHNFGGPRNPSNELYVFDASYCEANGLLGVALSDGSCRVLSILHNSETEQPICQEQCSLRLPPDYFSAKGGRGGHLTALSFDKTGTRLSTCFASGRVVLWSLQVIHDTNGMDVLHPSCISILEAGKLFVMLKHILDCVKVELL